MARVRWGVNGLACTFGHIEKVQQAVRHDAVQTRFADMRVQREDRIRLEYHGRLGAGAAKRRIDDLSIAHFSREQTQGQLCSLFPGERRFECHTASGQENVTFIEKMQRFESINGFFIQIRQPQIEFESVHLTGDGLGAQR